MTSPGTCPRLDRWLVARLVLASVRPGCIYGRWKHEHPRMLPKPRVARTIGEGRVRGSRNRETALVGSGSVAPAGEWRENAVQAQDGGLSACVAAPVPALRRRQHPVTVICMDHGPSGWQFTTSRASTTHDSGPEHFPASAAAVPGPWSCRVSHGRRLRPGIILYLGLSVGPLGLYRRP